MVGLGDNKYNSDEQQAASFVKYTLLPWMRLIEQSLARLLTPYERERYFCAFNQEGFLRGDHKTRMDSYTKGIGSGIYTINEVRTKEDLPTLDEGGDVNWIPANLMPVRDDIIEAYMAGAKEKMQNMKGQETQG